MISFIFQFIITRNITFSLYIFLFILFQNFSQIEQKYAIDLSVESYFDAPTDFIPVSGRSLAKDNGLDGHRKCSEYEQYKRQRKEKM